ncbi:MAG: ABC transporter ATP-binding protein [Phototrophicales bacterium]|nr:MAG: ABC transporter ATP-binding protein [Phototrophicales bacterium]RMG73111.1 MAG: DUF302 domain-containing protein [Chloroflexota bacterium]
MSAYGIRRILDVPYETAIEKITAALKEQGFGVLTEIDMKATLKKKLDVDVDQYVILGACNPHLAYTALQKEQEIGLLLPCNVIVYAHEGKSVVSILDPEVMMGVTDNDALKSIAGQAREKLEAALNMI